MDAADEDTVGATTIADSYFVTDKLIKTHDTKYTMYFNNIHYGCGIAILIYESLRKVKALN